SPEGQRGLLVSGDHFGGDAEDVPDAVDEHVAVGGVAGGGGGHEADPLGAVVGDQVPVAACGVQGALDSLGVEAAGAVDPVSQADHLQAAFEVHQRPGARVTAGDQQTDGVGAAVDRGDGGVVHRAPCSQRQ